MGAETSGGASPSEAAAPGQGWPRRKWRRARSSATGRKGSRGKANKEKRSRGQSTGRKQNVGRAIVGRTIETGGKRGERKRRGWGEDGERMGREWGENGEERDEAARRIPPRCCDLGPTSGVSRIAQRDCNAAQGDDEDEDGERFKGDPLRLGKKKPGRLTARSERFVCFSAAPFKAGTRAPDSRRRAGPDPGRLPPKALAAAQSPSGSSRAKRRSRSNRANKRRRSSSALRRA